jgi:hypothetical protein
MYVHTYEYIPSNEGECVGLDRDTAYIIVSRSFKNQSRFFCIEDGSLIPRLCSHAFHLGGEDSKIRITGPFVYDGYETRGCGMSNSNLVAC